MSDRLPENMQKLTANVKAAGCAAKLSPTELQQVLSVLPQVKPDQLLTSTENFEDAAVYKLTEDIAIVQTIDFFPPVVDDPFLYGTISATNALSDIYAMGAKPLLALNVLCFPTCDYPIEVVQEIVRGGVTQVIASGAVVAGGHSIQTPMAVYGLAVTGIVHPEQLLTNSGAKLGDRLILCKPIGTGVGLLGLKADMLSTSSADVLFASMSALNKEPAEIASRFPIDAATDVTGFGLIGHLHEMAAGSGLNVRLFADQVDLLPQTRELAEQGFVPAGAYGNRKSYEPFVSYINDVDLSLTDLFFDPQTSGGLLFALAPEQSVNLMNALRTAGYKACCVGEFTSIGSGVVEVIANGKEH